MVVQISTFCKILFIITFIPFVKLDTFPVIWFKIYIVYLNLELIILLLQPFLPML